MDKPKTRGAANGQQRETEIGYQASYAEFAKTLRTWFIAYGVGGPVLLVSQEVMSSRVNASGEAREIAAFFLAAVMIQVATALLWKVSMWYLYFGELKPATKSRLRYKVSDWVSEQFWLEFLLDATTLALFAWATFRVVMITTGEMAAP